MGEAAMMALDGRAAYRGNMTKLLDEAVTAVRRMPPECRTASPSKGAMTKLQVASGQAIQFFLRSRHA